MLIMLQETSFFNGNPASCLSSFSNPFTVNGTLPPAGAYCDNIVNRTLGTPYQKDYRS